MKRLIVIYVLFLTAFAAATASALDVVLQNQDGSALTDAADVSLKTSRTVSGGVETIRCVVTSKADGVRLLRVTATDRLPGATTLWDGKSERACGREEWRHPLYHDFTFLMGALWKPGEGLALGTGAEDFNSHADAIFRDDAISVSVHAALMKKGAVYSCTFHRFAFDPKYGIRDALARYYPLYPRRFFRNPDVASGFYGICSHYSSWTYADPEKCRRFNTSWEWCHGSDSVWGDLLNEERPSGADRVDYAWVERICFHDRQGKYVDRNKSKITSEAFDRIVDERLGYGYYCGAAHGFYAMLIAYISDIIARKYPDSLVVGETCTPPAYIGSTQVFGFPECSWGREIRRQMDGIVKKRDLGGMAFDVTEPSGVYRGERLSEMQNVSWDKFGLGVVRGVANAKFYEYIRTLPCKKIPAKMAVAGNNFYEHVTDMLYLDMTMHERSPWNVAKPFPLNSRFALGEKGLTFWEGYELESFDPNIWKTWPAEEVAMLKNDLARFCAHRSFLTGAALPAGFDGEYAASMTHAFVRMNAAGWKPVVGAVAHGTDFDLARYGLSDRSWLVVCNLTNATRRAVLDVFPGEIESGLVGTRAPAHGFVYAPFFGGEAAQRFRPDENRISVPVAAMGVRVLEAVGRVKGKGTLWASWGGDGCGKVTLTVRSDDFGGTFACRSSVDTYKPQGKTVFALKPGDAVTVEYRDETLATIAEALASSDLADPKIEHAADGDSRDMAERVARFFRSAAGLKDVSLKENAALGSLVISLNGCKIAAAGRMEFSDLVRRVLNALNARRYPAYRPQPEMELSDKSFVELIRY